MEYPKRKPNRLKDYDYSRNGAYFITLCVQNKRPILSYVSVGEGLAPPEMVLTPLGKIVQIQLSNLQDRYRDLFIDHYVIMPNHIHILLHLEHTGGASPSPTVPEIIGAFKSLTARECNKLVPMNKLFQRSYYDHIVRDENDYQVRWEYIDKNPSK